MGLINDLLKWRESRTADKKYLGNEISPHKIEAYLIIDGSQNGIHKVKSESYKNTNLIHSQDNIIDIAFVANVGERHFLLNNGKELRFTENPNEKVFFSDREALEKAGFRTAGDQTKLHKVNLSLSFYKPHCYDVNLSEYSLASFFTTVRKEDYTTPKISIGDLIEFQNNCRILQTRFNKKIASEKYMGRILQTRFTKKIASEEYMDGSSEEDLVKVFEERSMRDDNSMGK